MERKANRLLIRCMERGIKLYELADKVRLSESHLSRAGHGRVRLSPEKKREVAHILGTTETELFPDD